MTILTVQTSSCNHIKINRNKVMKHRLDARKLLIRVLTLDRLQKRGWVMANRCFLCHKSEETIDHLLIHCEKTRLVWMVFLSFFGVSWVFPRSVKETLLGWRGSFVGKKRKVAWQLGPLCLFWVIWKARNSIAFEDCGLSIQRLKAFLCIFCGQNPHCG